ncbi:hypothetical protein VPHD51_0028 [Vibrio phage D51]
MKEPLKDVMRIPEQITCDEAKLNVTNAKKALFYVLEGRRVDLMADNRVDADNWIRHIDQAYLDYSDALDEWKDAREALKEAKLKLIRKFTGQDKDLKINGR